MASLGCFPLPEEQFQCSVCQQVFTDPVTTPCGHNFCRACLRAAWDGGDVCRCPACDKPFTPRPEMSINAAFKELADAFRRAAAAVRRAEPGEVACDVCAATSLQVGALKSCLVCLTSYCEAHLEPHRRVGALMVHKLIEPATGLQERMCRKHERLLEMFCRDEMECVCRFCTETQHKGHRAVAVEEESGERKVQMKKSEEDFQLMIQERLKKVEEIQSCLKLSNTNTDTETEASDLLFASLIRSVEERQAEVNAEVKEKRGDAERRAEELGDELQQEISELQRRCAELQDLRDSEDHLNVLQKSPSLMSPPPTRDWAEIDVDPELCVGTLRGALSKLDRTLTHELAGLKKEGRASNREILQ
uniref:E3 ubiquitin/ISG15 ligase TRIM25-like n=1 Tax=Cyclopterus lumpus TaxID=8103 RepID=A0A8C3AAQ0_CYCLU